jgi:hypothetical protein
MWVHSHKTMEGFMANLNELSTEKMVALTLYWTKDERALLSSIPQAAGLLVSFDSIATRMFVVVKHELPPLLLAKDLYKRQTATDRTHDHILKGGYYQLSSLSHFAAADGDEARSASFLTLRDQLYPDGLGGSLLSFDEEAGAAELLEKRITDEMRAALKSIVTDQGVTLLARIEKQIEKAKELRSLEQQKIKAQEEADGAPIPSGNEARKVRYEWINAVRTLERTLRLARQGGTINEETESKLLRELRAAQEDLRQKAAQRKAEEEAKQKQETPDNDTPSKD